MGLYWHHSMLAPSERTSMLCSMVRHSQLMLTLPPAVGQMSGLPNSARQCSASHAAVRSTTSGSGVMVPGPSHSGPTCFSSSSFSVMAPRSVLGSLALA